MRDTLLKRGPACISIIPGYGGRGYHFSTIASCYAIKHIRHCPLVAGWRLLHAVVCCMWASTTISPGSRSKRVVKSVLLNQTTDSSCVGGTSNVTCLSEFAWVSSWSHMSRACNLRSVYQVAIFSSATANDLTDPWGPLNTDSEVTCFAIVDATCA